MEKGDSVKEKRAGCALRVARYGLRVAGCGVRVRVAGCALRGTGCGLRVARCEVRSTGYGEMGLRWGGENCLFS